MKKKLSILEINLLTIILTKIIKNKPDLIDYVFIYEILNLFTEEIAKLEDKIIKEVDKFYKNNFDLSVRGVNENLKEMGLPVSVNPDFKKYNSEYVNELIKKNMVKIKTDVKSNILNMFNLKDTKEVERYLKDYYKKGKKSNSLTNKIMRVYRTETTRMRSKMKLDIQKELEEKGYKVRRSWVHTLNVAENKISSTYTPRPGHILLDGVLEDEEGYFYTPNGRGQGPGLFGIPEEDINCRCDTTFVNY